MAVGFHGSENRTLTGIVGRKRQKPITIKQLVEFSQVIQGCGGGGGSEVDLIVAGKTIPFTVEGTGGYQNWKARELGEVTFDKAGEQRLEVRPKKKKGGAVMDIRRIRLLPVE